MTVCTGLQATGRNLGVTVTKYGAFGLRRGRFVKTHRQRKIQLMVSHEALRRLTETKLRIDGDQQSLGSYAARRRGTG
jgi:hypothetical protein